MFAAIAALALPGAAFPAIYNANAGNVGALLNGAQAGDKIVLHGVFDHLTINGRNWPNPITLDATGAQIVNLKILQSSGVVVRGGSWRPADWAAGVYIEGSGSVLLRDLAIENDGKWDGVVVRDSHDVTIQDSRFDRNRVALNVGKSHNVRLTGNSIKHAASDGIIVASSRDILIEGNSCEDPAILDPTTHPDCIQAWSDLGAPPLANLTARGNTVRGASQGVFVNDPRGLGSDNIVLEDNDVEISFPNGVYLEGARGGSVRGNKVRTTPGAQYQTRVSILKSPGVASCGNTAAHYQGSQAQADRPCEARSSRPPSEQEVAGRQRLDTH